MAISSEPQIEIAKRSLPAPLFESLLHIFSQNLSGCVLAGGTALSGFYAGHRRSDDIDLFTADPSAQRAATRAVHSLTDIGVTLEIQNESAQYFEGIGQLRQHLFKITVVLDSNLFRVGTVLKLKEGIQIVSLDTLFKMKAATLVSRCSEKDLFDLIWIFQQFPERSIADLIEDGNKIDAGIHPETLLSSIAGAILHLNACDFSLDPLKKSRDIFNEIQKFREEILLGIEKYLNAEPTPPLGALVHALKKLKSTQ